MSSYYRKKAKVENTVAMARYIEQKKKTTAQELAEKFDLSRRAVYRYVNALSKFLPIETQPGPGGGILWNDKKEVDKNAKN